MRRIALVVVAGCGRIRFDAQVDADAALLGAGTGVQVTDAGQASFERLTAWTL